MNIKAGLSHRDSPQEHCVKLNFGAYFAHIPLTDAGIVADMIENGYDLHAFHDLKGNVVSIGWEEGSEGIEVDGMVSFATFHVRINGTTLVYGYNPEFCDAFMHAYKRATLQAELASL